MIKEIIKGTDDNFGLPIVIKRTGYYHNEENNCIEIYFNRYIQYPTKILSLIEACTVVIKDTPAVPAMPAFDGKDLNLPSRKEVPAIPAGTKYTDYCKQFNADTIGESIDNYLESI